MKKLFSFLAISILCSVAMFAQEVNGKYILDKENSNITKYISETADSNGTELATVLILDDKTRDDVSSFLYDKAVPTELVIKNDKMTFVFPDKTEVSSNIEINKEKIRQGTKVRLARHCLCKKIRTTVRLCFTKIDNNPENISFWRIKIRRTQYKD